MGIEIHDGLGNQLFEFATAYALSRRTNAELLLDTRIIRRNEGRRFALAAMGVQWEECVAPNSRGAIRAIGRWLGFRPRNTFEGPVFIEPASQFTPQVLNLSSPVFLRGYFQFWRYFADCGGELRSQFDLSRLASGRTAPFEAAIDAAGAGSIAVHVRRGDYVAVRAPLLHRRYYDEALTQLSKGVPAPRVFIFSDDPAAAEELLGHWPNATFISGTSEFEDFYLMTRCASTIIANSTFSWWAAWLRRTPDAGKVVAPRKWLRDEDESGDRYPPEWILIT